jgi:hypothetical protein
MALCLAVTAESETLAGVSALSTADLTIEAGEDLGLLFR